MYSFLLISTLVTSYFSTVEGQSACSTPSNASGKCISLYDCKELLDLVNKAEKSQQDINTLKYSTCGYDGSTPKVCCPNTPPKSDSPPKCVTPDGKQGECISLSSCKHIADFVKPPVSKELIDFIQKSRCEGSDQHSVCCSASPDLTPNLLGLSDSKSCTTTRGIPSPASGCCGKQTSLDDRIIGGKVTTTRDYPWLVLIEYSENDRVTLLCGGALISDRYTLTAAHCFASDVVEQATPTSVRLGEFDTSNKIGEEDCITIGGIRDCTTGAVSIPIEKIITHPEYDTRDKRKRKHDIALLRMTKSAPFSRFIRPICLPTSDMTLSPPPGWGMIVAGWGYVNYTHGSNVKLQVTVPFVLSNICQAAYGRSSSSNFIGPGQFCAGGVAGKDSCKGDSGGPLMYINKKNIFECVGVVSFGTYPCAEEHVPGVYTKVYQYDTWIRTNVNP